jgi:hypothetical protein
MGGLRVRNHAHAHRVLGTVAFEPEREIACVGNGIRGDEVISIVPVVAIVLQQAELLRSREYEFVIQTLGHTMLHVGQRSLPSVEGQIELIRARLLLIDALDGPESQPRHDGSPAKVTRGTPAVAGALRSLRRRQGRRIAGSAAATGAVVSSRDAITRPSFKGLRRGFALVAGQLGGNVGLLRATKDRPSCIG